MASNWREWISDRFGFKEIRNNFLFRRVPKDPWFAGDGQAMLLLLAIQVATGAVLALGYSPSLESAYPSVVYMTKTQTLGWFVRALHYWSGGTWIVLLLYHLFRQILIAGYKSPREGTWLVGVLLFFLVWIMAFIGYTLRWDERAVYAFRVAMFHFGRAPIIGDKLVTLIQGGPEITTLTLTRLYAVHAVIGPILLLGLATYHVYLIVVRGTVAPTEKEKPIDSAEEQKRVYERDAQSEERGETFYPETPARLSWIPALTFLTVMGLALTLGTQELYPEANLIRPTFPREEWWFAWYSALAALLPPRLAPLFYVGFPVLLFLVLVALPFVDRSPYRGIRKRPVAVAVVAVCVIGIVYLSSLRRRSPWTGWPVQEPPPVPAGVQWSGEAERGRVLFAAYGCNSCHAIAGHGRHVGPDLTNLRQRYSREQLRNYILHPPEGVAMPAYAGHITEEDLEEVVNFVLVAQTFPSGRSGEAVAE